jgi:hypothetical protein
MRSENPFVGVSTIVGVDASRVNVASNDPLVNAGSSVFPSAGYENVVSINPGIVTGASKTVTTTTIQFNSLTPIIEAGVDPYLLIVNIDGSYSKDYDINGSYYLNIAI